MPPSPSSRSSDDFGSTNGAGSDVASDDKSAVNLSDDDYDGLTLGLAGLSGMVAGASTLEALLAEVATFAVQATPGADGAGVTVIEAGQADTIVASAQFVRDVDAIQYRLGEGPCISATSNGATTASPYLAQDPNWPNFGPLAAAVGVQSVISFPLVVDSVVFGSLNVYSHEVNAFDGSSQQVGERFAGPAAVAIHNARMLAKALRTAEQLETALRSRSIIDRAIGIIQSRSGVSGDEAFVRLRVISQREHTKLAVVAGNLVEEAVRRANGRSR
jgi:GAF domain-containing protein